MVELVPLPHLPLGPHSESLWQAKPPAHVPALEPVP